MSLSGVRAFHAKYDQRDQIHEKEIGEHAALKEDRNIYRVLMWKSADKGHFEDTGLQRRIILNQN